jgi:flavodoxin
MAKSKTLVVYYSRSGTTRALAKAIAEALRCDIEEIAETTSRAGVLGYMRSIFEAIWRIPSPIKTVERDPGSYDLVIIGTPVWAGSVSSPVRSYLTANKAHFGETAFFCTLGGRGSDSAFGQMEALTGRPPRARCAVRASDVESSRYAADVSRFVGALGATSAAQAQPAGAVARA